MGLIDLKTTNVKETQISFGKPSYLNKQGFGFIVEHGADKDFHEDFFSEGKISEIAYIAYEIDVKVNSSREYTFEWNQYPVSKIKVGDQISGSTVVSVVEGITDRGVKKITLQLSMENAEDIEVDYNKNEFIGGVVIKNRIEIQIGNYYTFKQEDKSNQNHYLKFSTTNDGPDYSNEVTYGSSSPGSFGAYTRLKAVKETPSELWYKCGNHESMGGNIEIEEGCARVKMFFDSPAERDVRISGGLGDGNFVGERIMTLAAEYDRSFCDTPENIQLIKIWDWRPAALHGYGEFAGMVNLTSLTLPKKQGPVTMIKSLDPASKIQNVTNGGEMHFVRTFADTKFTTDPANFNRLVEESENCTKLESTFENSLWNGTFFWNTSKVKDWTNCFKNSAFVGTYLDTSAAEIIDGMFSGPNCAWSGKLNGLNLQKCISAKRVFQDKQIYEGPINAWVIPNVTSLQGFYQGNSRTETIFLKAPAATDFSYFFAETNNFNGVFSLQSEASNVDFTGFFKDSTGFIENANWMWGMCNLSKAKSLKDFFRGSDYAGVIAQWFPVGHSVTNISGMFAEMKNDYYPNLLNWDFNPIEDISYLFENSKASMPFFVKPFENVLTCEGFYKDNPVSSTPGIRNWRFPKCKNFSRFFENTVGTFVIDWLKTGNHVGEDFSYMFANSKFNSGVFLDLTSAKNTSYMFENTTLTQDIMGFQPFPNLENAEGMFQGSNYSGRTRNWLFPKLVSAKNMFKNTVFDHSKLVSNLWFWANSYPNQAAVLEDISGMFEGSNYNKGMAGWNWINNSVKKANRAFANTQQESCSGIIQRLRFFRNLVEFNEIFRDCPWLTNECDLTVLLQDVEAIKSQINLTKGTSFTGRWRDVDVKQYESDTDWKENGSVIVKTPALQNLIDCSNKISEPKSMIEISYGSTNSVVLPLAGIGVDGVRVEFEQTFEEYTTADQGNITINFSENTNQTVRILGDITHFGAIDTENNELKTSANLVESITLKGDSFTSMEGAFANMNNAAISGFEIDYSKITSFKEMFKNCTQISSLDLSGLNVSKVVTMESMFSGCTSLSEFLCSGWNTSALTNTSNMFNGCSALSDLNINDWNASSIVSISGMFDGCSSLKSIDLSKWNNTIIESFENMFRDASSLTVVDLSNVAGSSATSMYGMFEGCGALVKLLIPILVSDYKVTTTFDRMFMDCTSLDNTFIDFANWCVSHISQAPANFSDSSKFTSLPAWGERCEGEPTYDINDFIGTRVLAFTDQGDLEIYSLN